MRQRQNLENEESAQKYDNLVKLKNRLEVERDEGLIENIFEKF